MLEKILSIFANYIYKFKHCDCYKCVLINKKINRIKKILKFNTTNEICPLFCGCLHQGCELMYLTENFKDKNNLPHNKYKPFMFCKNSVWFYKSCKFIEK